MVFSFLRNFRKKIDQETQPDIPPKKQGEDIFVLVDAGDAGTVHTQGWSLEADRHLVALWFFTAHSFFTIANILNYSIGKEHKPPFRITKQMAKQRLQLLQSSTYNRAFVYHEFEKKDDWDPEVRQLDFRFLTAFRTMMSVVEKEDHDWEQWGERGKNRRWSADQRSELKVKKYKGLQHVSKGVRPQVLDDDYDSDTSIDGKA